MAMAVALASASPFASASASASARSRGDASNPARMGGSNALQASRATRSIQPIVQGKRGELLTPAAAKFVTKLGSLANQEAVGTASTDGNVKTIYSSEEFQKYTEEAGDKLVVLDISTKTCGPCKVIYPKFVQLSLEYPDAVFLKINGDHDENTRALMRQWGVRSVPNFRFFKKGELVHKHTGAKEEELRKNFAAHYP